jgi:hyperosmotically inducible periplasmic protein
LRLDHTKNNVQSTYSELRIMRASRDYGKDATAVPPGLLIRAFRVFSGATRPSWLYPAPDRPVEPSARYFSRDLYGLTRIGEHSQSTQSVIGTGVFKTSSSKAWLLQTFSDRAGQQRGEMGTRRSFLAVLPLLVAGMLAACSTTNKSPDVTDNIHKSLDQAGYKDVSVSQDRDKGVVTLTGTVTTDSDKASAESIAKSNAGSQVIANQIAVRPPENRSEAKAVDADMDKAIEKNLDAVLIKNKLKRDVKYEVKNGVVTLTGNAPSQSRRTQVEKLVAGIPNVKQVVNELDVKNQKASTTAN